MIITTPLWLSAVTKVVVAYPYLVRPLQLTFADANDTPLGN
jgi:hypothetical protein